MSISFVIQAGGESTRMGGNKALMPFLGEPLVARVARRLAPLTSEILVTSNSPDDFKFLNLPLVIDLLPGRGALGGLYTALAVVQRPVLAVVACDLPFINPDLLKAQLALLAESGADLVVPESPDGVEPMHAVYRREPCLAAVLRALEAGECRLRGWYSLVNARIMSPREVSAYDPEFRSFINLNTPEEFRRAENLARALGETPQSGTLGE
jgi:molybdopterin-guanine dinucleotide biosynthesis protein A